MVVRDRLAQDPAGRAARISNHLLSQQARHRRRQSQRLRAASTLDRALRPQRSQARPALAGSANSPRRSCSSRRLPRAIPTCGSNAGRSSARREVRWRKSMPRISRWISRLPKPKPSLLNGDAGISRKGPLPQAASYYYSLPHLKVSGSISRKGAKSPGQRRGVVRSRMVQRVSGRRGDWLGLDRHQPGRRRRADGVSHPRAARRAALGRRHVSQRRGPGADLAARGY